MKSISEKMPAGQQGGRPRTPGSAAAPLMHWLALISGLAVLTVQRIDTPGKVVPMWIGGIVGTAFGQILAARRFRLWLALVALANAMFFGALLSAPLWLPFGRGGGEELELAVLSFAPATICGYLALGERTAIAGLWFPAVPWTLTVLDGASGGEVNRALLLTGPAFLMIGALYAHETRRVALWRGRATVDRLAAARAGAVLRVSPSASLARAAWAAVVAGATLALTAAVAPLLFQHEEAARAATARAIAAAEEGVTECCPEIPATPTVKVREYFSPLAAHARPSNPFPNECALCESGAPVVTPPRTKTSDPLASLEAADSNPPPTPATRGVTSGLNGAASAAPSATPPVNDATGSAKTPDPIAAAGGTKSGVAPRPRRSRSGGVRAGMTAGVATLPTGGRVTLAGVVDEPRSRAPWLLVLLVSGLVVHLGLRPLRRALALRHLRLPLWPEPVDQRVSNLWQLALVGLRDAGLCTTPGEAPQAIARRSGLADMATCATVLERARHGVRVDAGDVDTMRRAAVSVYTTARAAAGWPARAMSWFRWPLA